MWQKMRISNLLLGCSQGFNLSTPCVFTLYVCKYVCEAQTQSIDGN